MSVSDSEITNPKSGLLGDHPYTMEGDNASNLTW